MVAPHAARGGVAGGRVERDLRHQRGGVELEDLGVGAHEAAHHGRAWQVGVITLFQCDDLAHCQLQLIGYLLYGPAHRFALGGQRFTGHTMMIDCLFR